MRGATSSIGRARRRPWSSRPAPRQRWRAAGATGPRRCGPGPALLATLGPDEFQSTLQMNVDFLRPTRPGRVRGRGRVRHRDGDHAVVEAALLDADGTLLATATAVARVIGLAAARGAV